MLMSLRKITTTAFAFWQAVEAVTLTVSTSGGNASSPILYGLMFEDINYSGDGGVHGQLLQSNGFQGSSPNLDAYGAVGGTQLSIDTQNPLTDAITKSLKVTVPSGSSGKVGFSNSGYNGVPVNKDTYQSYFWMKGTYSGSVTIQLLGPDGHSYASKDVAVDSTSDKYTYYTATFDSEQSPSGDNVWQLTFDAASATDGALYFDLVQLFGVTFHERYNGLRKDVATFMDEIGGSFLRFPGGNNLEGNSLDSRWQWNLTVGPVEDRPGRDGTWGYPNTDALGLMEYMQWVEDMNLETVLAIWAGHALNGDSITGSALDPYVTDSLNELEFLLGDSSTPYGSYRAKLGRSDPYKITMVEIGNEDNLSNGCGSYAERFTAFYDAIHKAYPDMIIIASTTDQSCLPSTLGDNVWTDIHYYLPPDQFVRQFNEWDNWDRKHPIFVGEYASTTGNDGSTTYWSNMQGSCAEAVYMIGMERNSDVVKIASFAPLLEHFDMAQWSPDLFGFNNTAGSLAGSTSYYVQKLFASNRGANILPVDSDGAFGPVYWVASSTSDGKYVVKLANYGDSQQSVTVKIPGASASAASLQLLSGPVGQSNYPGAVAVQPATSNLQGDADGGYTLNMPAWAVGVVTVG